jgi:hypothetical protein
MMVVMDKVIFYFFLASNDADWNQATNFDHVPELSRVNFWLTAPALQAVHTFYIYLN